MRAHIVIRNNSLVLWSGTKTFSQGQGEAKGGASTRVVNQLAPRTYRYGTPYYIYILSGGESTSLFHGKDVEI